MLPSFKEIFYAELKYVDAPVSTNQPNGFGVANFKSWCLRER